MDYVEFRQHCLTGRKSKAFLLCGSIFELPLKYFLSNPTDSDRMYYVKDICAIPSSRNPPKNFKGTVLVIESKGDHPGFVRLKLMSNSYFVRPHKLAEDEIDGPARVTHREFVFPSGLKAALQYFSPLWKNMRAMKTDISYSVYCPYWPLEAQEWLTRKRQHGWPNESMITRVKKGGCHFVSKPHQSNPNDETQWRFSFSKAELILIHSWNLVQQKIYHLLRLAKNKVCKGNSSTALSTYHFKTLMLWACEQKPSEFWNENNITVCLRELLNEMIQTLKDRHSPNYFIPENNMLDHLEGGDFENELKNLEIYVKQERYDCVPAIITTIQQDIPGFWLSNTFLEFGFMTIRTILFPVYEELNASLRDKLYKCACFLPELKQLHNALKANIQLMSIENASNTVADRDYSVILNGYRAALNASTDESRIKLIFPSSQLDRSLSEMVHEMVVWPVILHRANNETNFGNQCEFSEFEGDYEIQFPTQEPSNEVTGRSFSIKRIIVEKLSTYLMNKFARESSKQMPSPIYLMSAAYLANFYYTALSDYDAVLRLLNEVYQSEAKIRRLFGFYIYFITNLPMIISTDFSAMFDEHVRTVIGFVMLCKTFSRSSTENLQKVVFPLSSIRFMRYIEYQCTLKTNNEIPKVFAYTPDNHESVNNSASMTVCFSEAFLTAAMRCNGVKVLRVSSKHFHPDFSFGRVLGRVSCRIENDDNFQSNTLLQMLNCPNNASDFEIQLELRGIGFVMAELQATDFILYFHFQSTDDVKLMQKKLRNGTVKTLVQNDFNRLLNRSEVLISVSVKWFPSDYDRCVKSFNDN